MKYQTLRKYLNKESEDSSEPIDVFCEWKQIVENLIEEKTQKKRFSIQRLLGNCCRGLGTSTRSE